MEYVIFNKRLDTRASGYRALINSFNGMSEGMAKKLIIIMVNTDPRNGEELGAPFFQATVAAAMDYEVEVVCTATAGQLMKKGVAEKLVVKPGSPRRSTISSKMRTAPE